MKDPRICVQCAQVTCNWIMHDAGACCMSCLTIYRTALAEIEAQKLEEEALEDLSVV